MHIISTRRLREFWEIYAASERPLRAWFNRVEGARWQNFVELRRDFPAADLVGRFTIFNIAGNHYRLVARVEFQRQRVYVRAVLTHAEYDAEHWKDDHWFA